MPYLDLLGPAIRARQCDFASTRPQLSTAVLPTRAGPGTVGEFGKERCESVHPGRSLTVSDLAQCTIDFIEFPALPVVPRCSDIAGKHHESLEMMIAVDHHTRTRGKI